MAFLRAMRVQLEENVRINAGSEVEPAANPVPRGHIVTGKFSAISIRGRAVPSSASPNGPGNHQEITA